MLGELREVAAHVRTRITRLVLSNKRDGFLRVASVEPEDFLPKRREIRHTHFCAGIEGLPQDVKIVLAEGPEVKGEDLHRLNRLILEAAFPREVRKIYDLRLAAIHRRLPADRSALCLSGGGIRSAVFSLGVLQGLARCRLLGKFDYLSTVSGGGYMGIGFAVPSNMAKSVLTSLIKTGKVVRGWLGISIQEVNPKLAQEFGLPKTEGALVADVLSGSPAERAGIKRGDVILEVNGKKIEHTGQLRNLVADLSVGEKVSVKIFRDKQQKELEVAIG